MVEYGPFIEYCCELYVHHYVLNIIVAVLMVFSGLITLAFSLLSYHLGKKHCIIHGNAADLLPFLD